MFDRESKGVKFLKTAFLGCRIQSQFLGALNPGDTTSRHTRSREGTPSHGRRSTAFGNQSTLRGSAIFVGALERMKDSVLAHLEAKKALEKSKKNRPASQVNKA